MNVSGGNRAVAAVLVLALSALAPPTLAQMGTTTPTSDQGCVPAGMNGQCNELGTILMDFQKDVTGTPVDVTTRITLETTFKDREARTFLFSVRNVTAPGDGPSPVTVELVNFTSTSGEISVTKTERPGANELDMWVDVLDVPVHEPIDITVRAGATDRGAFRLETLAMPFDRAYHPIRGPDGAEASLFSFTFLAVNKQTEATASTSSTGLDHSLVRSLPGAEPVIAVAAIAVVALLLAGPRRRRATPLQMFRRP
jgi:hypothetical protein